MPCWGDHLRPDRTGTRARRQAATLTAVLAFVGLLLVIGIFKVWTGRSGPPVSNAAPSSSVRRDGGPDLRWEAFRPGHDLPESLSAGPARHTDGRAEGFARSQLGAALAAVHISHRIDPPRTRVFEPTIREQVVGPDAGKLLRRLRPRTRHSGTRKTRHPANPSNPDQHISWPTKSSRRAPTLRPWR